MFSTLRTIAGISFFILLVALLFCFKTILNLQEEVERQTENLSQITKVSKNLMYQQNLTTEELKEYIEYKDKNLQESLTKEKIRLNRILNIVSVWQHTKDTLVREFRVDTVLVAIKDNKPYEQVFVDTSSCFKIKGSILYNNNTLSLKIKEKEYNNKINGVLYTQRKEWEFLGFKTRFLGKKEITAKVFDPCGNSQILQIHKSK